MTADAGTFFEDLMSNLTGRHFLQIPGPTNTPLPVLAAIAKPTIDHRSPEFRALALHVLSGIRTVFRTTKPVIIYPVSGTGAWEAALVNTLSPGDTVLMAETGWFSTLWSKMATRLGICPEIMPGIGDNGSIRGRSRRGWRRIVRTGSGRSQSSTTKLQPASPRAYPRCVARSTPPTIRLFFWSIPYRPLAR